MARRTVGRAAPRRSRHGAARPGGPGATNFDDGDFGTIIRSISDKLFTFPDDTIVLPGHGDDTTIGSERPHLEEWIERGW